MLYQSHTVNTRKTSVFSCKHLVHNTKYHACNWTSHWHVTFLLMRWLSHVLTAKRLAPMSNEKHPRPTLSMQVAYDFRASMAARVVTQGRTQASSKLGLIAAMNLLKKFIRSISQRRVYLKGSERGQGESIRGVSGRAKAAGNDKDLFSAMIKYLCWGIQVKLLFVFWFNEWFEAVAVLEGTDVGFAEACANARSGVRVVMCQTAAGSKQE